MTNNIITRKVNRQEGLPLPGSGRPLYVNSGSSDAVIKASTPVNGVEGLGGSPGATIAGDLIGGRGSSSLIGGASPSVFNDTVKPSSGYVHAPHLQGLTNTAEEPCLPGIMPAKPRVVGWGKINQLLQPKHRYFEGKKGYVTEWQKYEDEVSGFYTLYPRIKAQHRDNPYRKRQLTHRSTGRTATLILDLIEAYNLDFKVADLVTTVPEETSEHLASRGKAGRDAMWRMNEKFWKECEAVGIAAPGQARSSNLHVWKTEEPTQPHFHIHELIPNYVAVEAEGYSDENDQPAFGEELVRSQWHRQRGGKEVPYSDDELHTMKSIWTLIVKRYVRKHGIKCMFFDDKTATLNVHVEYVEVKGDMGRSLLLHKLNYKARHWSEDYARYSNENSSCPDPPCWLEGYSNKTRVFGWWRDMRNLLDAAPDAPDRILEDDRAKLSPYNGRKMRYIGAVSTRTVVEMHEEGGLVAVDFIKGRPIERVFTSDDIAMLKSIAWNCLPGAMCYTDCPFRSKCRKQSKQYLPLEEEHMHLQGLTTDKVKEELPLPPEDILVAQGGGDTLLDNRYAKPFGGR